LAVQFITVPMLNADFSTPRPMISRLLAWIKDPISLTPTLTIDSHVGGATVK